MVRLLAIAFSGIVLMMIAAQVLLRHPDLAQEEPRVAALGTEAAAGSASGRIVLLRDRSGQFHLTGAVNGEDTPFLVDTGADIVALSVDEAERLGLDADPASFEPIMQTASGVGYGMVVQLDTLEVAGAEFRDVEAVVLDGLEVNLLGQSVLRQMGRVELRGDRMVIQRR